MKLLLLLISSSLSSSSQPSLYHHHHHHYSYILMSFYSQEGVRFVDSLDVPQPNYHRTTAQELYDTLKSQRLKVNSQMNYSIDQ